VLVSPTITLDQLVWCSTGKKKTRARHRLMNWFLGGGRRKRKKVQLTFHGREGSIYLWLPTKKSSVNATKKKRGVLIWEALKKTNEGRKKDQSYHPAEKTVFCTGIGKKGRFVETLTLRANS